MAKTGNRFIDEHIIIGGIPPIDPKKLQKVAKAEKPTIRVDWKHSKGGWTVGDIYYKGGHYIFEMKNFLEGSVYGIDNGCISKLFVRNKGGEGVEHIIYGKVVMNYDRGWDIRPINNDAKDILKALKERFNNGMNASDKANYLKYVW